VQKKAYSLAKFLSMRTSSNGQDGIGDSGGVDFITMHAAVYSATVSGRIRDVSVAKWASDLISPNVLFCAPRANAIFFLQRLLSGYLATLVTGL
jgi:hypothetical protein